MAPTLDKKFIELTIKAFYKKNGRLSDDVKEKEDFRYLVIDHTEKAGRMVVVMSNYETLINGNGAKKLHKRRCKPEIEEKIKRMANKELFSNNIEIVTLEVFVSPTR